MRNYIFGLVLLVLTVSCSSSAKDSNVGENSQETLDTTLSRVKDTLAKATEENIYLKTTKPSVAYNNLLSALDIRKKKIKADYKSGLIGIDSVEGFFTYNLVYGIFPYWYGTPWTFEGHTNVPNQGEVACGYFVSTTLKHFGMKVNRYKMAQQAALTGLKMITAPDNIHLFKNDSFGDAANKIAKKIEPGIYMIGFDYHVGFLFIDSKGLHFIHSNYMDPVAVVHENALYSPAFNNTTYVYLAKISNKDFLIKWMDGVEFTVP